MKSPFLGFLARDKPRDAVSSTFSFHFGTSGSGKWVTVSTAIQMRTAYDCVHVIADAIAIFSRAIPSILWKATERIRTALHRR